MAEDLPAPAAVDAAPARLQRRARRSVNVGFVEPAVAAVRMAPPGTRNAAQLDVLGRFMCSAARIFGSLSPEILEELCQCLEYVKVPAGCTLADEGAMLSDLIFIGSGAVELTRDAWAGEDGEGFTEIAPLQDIEAVSQTSCLSHQLKTISVNPPAKTRQKKSWSTVSRSAVATESKVAKNSLELSRMPIATACFPHLASKPCERDVSELCREPRLDRPVGDFLASLAVASAEPEDNRKVKIATAFQAHEMTHYSVTHYSENDSEETSEDLDEPAPTVTTLIFPGAVLGLQAVLENTVCDTDATTVDECELLQVPASKVLHLFGQERQCRDNARTETILRMLSMIGAAKSKERGREHASKIASIFRISHHRRGTRLCTQGDVRGPHSESDLLRIFASGRARATMTIVQSKRALTKDVLQSTMQTNSQVASEVLFTGARTGYEGPRDASHFVAAASGSRDVGEMRLGQPINCVSQVLASEEPCTVVVESADAVVMSAAYSELTRLMTWHEIELLRAFAEQMTTRYAPRLAQSEAGRKTIDPMQPVKSVRDMGGFFRKMTNYKRRGRLAEPVSRGMPIRGSGGPILHIPSVASTAASPLAPSDLPSLIVRPSSVETEACSGGGDKADTRQGTSGIRSGATASALPRASPTIDRAGARTRISPARLRRTVARAEAAPVAESAAQHDSLLPSPTCGRAADSPLGLDTDMLSSYSTTVASSLGGCPESRGSPWNAYEIPPRPVPLASCPTPSNANALVGLEMRGSSFNVTPVGCIDPLMVSSLEAARPIMRTTPRETRAFGAVISIRRPTVAPDIDTTAHLVNVGSLSYMHEATKRMKLAAEAEAAAANETAPDEGAASRTLPRGSQSGTVGSTTQEQLDTLSTAFEVLQALPIVTFGFDALTADSANASTALDDASLDHWSSQAGSWLAESSHVFSSPSQEFSRKGKARRRPRRRGLVERVASVLHVRGIDRFLDKTPLGQRPDFKRESPLEIDGDEPLSEFDVDVEPPTVGDVASEKDAYIEGGVLEERPGGTLRFSLHF